MRVSGHARRTADIAALLSAALLPVLVSSLLGIWYLRQTLITEAAERVDRTARRGADPAAQLTTLARETRESPAAALSAQPAIQ